MKTLLTPYQIRAGVLKIAEKLMTCHSTQEPLVMIGVMRGGFMFYTDLLEELQNIFEKFVGRGVAINFQGIEKYAFGQI